MVPAWQSTIHIAPIQPPTYEGTGGVTRKKSTESEDPGLSPSSAA